MSHSNIITYADDTAIYVSGKNKDEVRSKLQADFQTVSEWFQSVDVIINMKKGKDWVHALWNISKSEEQKFDYGKQQQGGIKYSHTQLSQHKTRPIAIP